MKHRLKLVVPASLVLLIAACGPQEEAAKPIVFSLEQTSRSATAEAALDSNADQKMASGAMMAPAITTTYVVDGELPALDGKAASWKSDGEPTKKQMRRVADALGIDAELDKQPDALGGGYVAGPTDGSGPVVTFSNSDYDAFHSWWYSPKLEMSSRTAVSEPAVDPAPVVTEDTVVTGDTVVTEDTVIAPAPDEFPEPEKPENLPSKDEARALVEEFLDRAGVKADGIDVQADEWGVWANAWQTFEGMRAPFAWNFGFGADSELTYASGNLLNFTEASSFPRVGTTVGVERLSNPKYSGWYGYGAVARDIAATPEVGEADSDTKEAVEPVQEPAAETVEVKITGVKESLMSVVDADGIVWLLPAYEYDTADGYSVSTLSITDEFIVQEETPTPDTSTANTAENTVVDSGDGEGSSPGSPGSSGASDVVPPTENDAAGIIGLAEDEAVKVIEAMGWTSRVGSRDGKEFMLTTDYSETRLTLSIEAGIVTNAVIG